MATLTINRPQDRQTFGGTPYGNLSILPFILLAHAAGVIAGTGTTAAPLVGDVIRLGTLPAGLRLDDSAIVVSTGITGLQGKLGFAYEDGVNDTAVPEDDDYFGSPTFASAARLRNATTNAPVVLPKDAWLELTVTHVPTAAGRAVVQVFGEQVGAV